MAETIASVPVGSGTLNLDMAQLTAIISSVATTVSRQIMTIGDPNTQLGLVTVTGATGMLVDDSGNSGPAQILAELRAIRYILQHMADRDVSPDITDTDIN
jgi:hypothetical protein